MLKCSWVKGCASCFFQDVRLFLQADFFCCDGGCGVWGRKFDGLTGRLVWGRELADLTGV